MLFLLFFLFLFEPGRSSFNYILEKNGDENCGESSVSVVWMNDFCYVYKNYTTNPRMKRFSNNGTSVTIESDPWSLTCSSTTLMVTDGPYAFSQCVPITTTSTGHSFYGGNNFDDLLPASWFRKRVYTDSACTQPLAGVSITEENTCYAVGKSGYVEYYKLYCNANDGTSAIGKHESWCSGDPISLEYMNNTECVRITPEGAVPTYGRFGTELELNWAQFENGFFGEMYAKFDCNFNLSPSDSKGMKIEIPSGFLLLLVSVMLLFNISLF